MRALLGRLLLAAMVAMSTVLIAAPPAQAAGSVSWSVEPVTATGDTTGHAWAELTMDPGTRQQQYLRVTNRGAEAVAFSLSAADGYFTDAGRFTMLPAGRTSVDAGTWITLPASVSVDPGASAVVPFTVEVPANATPGDHLAGVAAGIFSEQDTVGVESRIGFRVLTRVTGDVAPAVSTTATADYHPSWNPFLPGRLEVRLSTRNAGNTRLTAQNDVAVAGPLGLAPRTSRPDALPELAPGDERQATVTVDDVWPLFAMTAVVTTTAADAGGSSDGVTATTRVTVPAMPWSQLLVGGCAVALVVLALWDRRRRRRRWAGMVQEAREQGRRDAAAGVWTLAIAVLVALGTLTMTPSSARASEPVGVTVEISPQPEPMVTQTGLGAGHALAQTGASFSPLLTLSGLGVIAVGVMVWTISRRREVQRASSPRDHQSSRSSTRA
jgi:LPXTG-motif cell wall-anchored protein